MTQYHQPDPLEQLVAAQHQAHYSPPSYYRPPQRRNNGWTPINVFLLVVGLVVTLGILWFALNLGAAVLVQKSGVVPVNVRPEEVATEPPPPSRPLREVQVTIPNADGTK